MKKIYIQWNTALCCCIASLWTACTPTTSHHTSENAQPEPVIVYEYGIPVDSFQVHEGCLKNGEVISSLLLSLGAPAAQVHALNFLPDTLFNAKRIQSGKEYTVYSSDDSIGSLCYFVYHESLARHIVLSFGDSLRVTRFDKPIRREQSIRRAEISSSLWNAITSQNLDPTLALRLSDIYSWTIDFFGIQKGDGFTVYYEELYVDSTCIGIGTIYAARFRHNGRDYYAFRYGARPDSTDYWDEEGNSLRKAFLKAPLQFSRISSTFSYARKHPVYKVVRPHTGVDYAAPTGTPVRSIGDGRVIAKGYMGGGGHTVKIKHNSVYTTAYLHLSRYAPGIAPGASVRQGQVIGYVGSTGASTGPHLDFRVWKNGHPINPLTLESPPALPLPAKYKAAYTALCDSLRPLLAPEE